MLAQMFLQKLARDSATPELVGFGRVFRPRALFPPKVNRSVSFKIDRLLEKFFYLGKPFVDPHLVEIVDLVNRLEGAQKNVVIDRATILLCNPSHVYLGEQQATETAELE